MELKKEQAEVIFHDEGDLLVSASAGSGKTFAMIRRLIRLVVEGKARVSEILAVTFTEKAAAEMREKLLKAMLREIAAGKESLKSQLADVYTADISTVHAFCGRLLRKYFFEAGLSQDFEIMDESRARELKNRTIGELFEELYAAEDEKLALLAGRHARKRKDRDLKETVLSLCEFAFSEADPAATLRKSAENYTEEKGGYFYDSLLAELYEEFDRGLHTFNAYAAQLDMLGESKAEEYARAVAGLCERRARDKNGLPRFAFKCATEEGEAIKECMRCAREDVFDAVDGYAALGEREEEIEKLLACGAHTEALIYLCEKFMARYAEEKRECNAVDFNDLEHGALALLNIESVRGEVRSRYKYVFADEYQDTNGVQEMIFRAVSRDNLFMVGDLKQSIYGFRGCNSKLFEEKERAFTADGRVKYLNYNFRSAPEIIDNVNRIFDHCMKADFSGVDYAGTSRLVSGGLYGERRGRFSLDILRAEKKKRVYAEPRVYDILEESAEGEEFALGNFLADLIEREIGKDYFDAESGCMRRVGYGDVAVLLRSRGSLAERLVKQLLRRGIPSEAEAGSVVDYAEIKALTDVLRLVDNFRQDVPLCSALKNLYSFTDEELAEIRLYADAHAPDAAGERTFCDAYDTALGADTALGEKLRSFDKYIKKLRLYAAQARAADVLRAVMADTALELRIAASFEGNGKLRRAERFVAAAENFTVREFLSRIENAPSEFKLSEAAGTDAVKILTIHASKGLEYPVVFVVGLDKKFNFADCNAKVVKTREYGFAVQFYDDVNKTYGDTVLRKFLKSRIRAEAVREELRLFYVALTRAKYSLHLVGTAAPEERDIRRADRYLAFLPPDLPVAAEETGAAGGGKEPTKVFVGEGDERLRELIGKNLAYAYPFEADTRLKLKTSVTAAAAKDEDEPMNYLSLDEEITTERGIAMHKFMENLDFSAEDAASELSRQRAEGLIGEDQAALLSLPALQKLLESGVLGFLNGYTLFREQWFTVNVPAPLCGLEGGEIMLQGIIDLLAVKGDEAVLVDYKYSGKDAPSLVKTYERQLSLYKYAVEKSLPLKVQKTYILSLAQAELIEI